MDLEAVPPPPTPELAFIGCLLHGDAGHASTLLRLVHAHDFADPRLRVLVELIRAVAEQGVDPTPGAILAEARMSAAVAGQHQLAQVGQLLMRAYTCSAGPPAGAYFRRGVLAGALERTLTATATRLAQVARDYPPSRYHDAVHRALVDFDQLWKRWLDAGGADENEADAA